MADDLVRARELLAEARRLEAEARQLLKAAPVGDTVTPLYLANVTGLTYEQVLRDIREHELSVIRVQRGERVRFLIRRDEADRWLRQIGLAHLATLDTLPTPPAA